MKKTMFCIKYKQLRKIEAYLTFTDKKFEILNILLFDGRIASRKPESNYILQSLNAVLSDDKLEAESGTERVMMHITKNETLLTDNFDGVYDNIDILPPLKVSTTDLRDLIIWWIQEKPRLEKIANDGGLSADELNATSDNIDS